MNVTTGEQMTFVAQEGRREDLIGLKLLCASVARCAPAARGMIYVSDDIIGAVHDFISQVPVPIEIIKFEGKDWTCKPLVLLDALRRKQRRVTWLDSDVVLIREPTTLYGLDAQTIVIAEESAPGAHLLVRERQRALKLVERRSFDTTLSSAVLSVTDVHKHVLEQWSELMTSDIFMSEQRLNKYQRTLFHGDQEVLEAVICSCAKVPVSILFNDVDLLQANWYSKVRKVRGRSPFAIHATGDLKPWKGGSRLNQEVFPYFETARTYLHVLTESERKVFVRRSVISTLIKHMPGGFRTYRRLRRLIGRVPLARALLWKSMMKRS